MDGSYVIAVVGGACAGSELAAQLADCGVEVVVFEQNPLPYGKIEDGLPRWHEKLQAKEKERIDGRLTLPSVHLVPNCKLGVDIPIEALSAEWGFPMVVMANGAWRDRELRVEGLDQVRDDSFVYQNPFVYWFNHYHEKNYSGTTYRVPPGAMVIGGGLASIDVVKIFQFEIVREVLQQHGHSVTPMELDHYGIHAALEKAGLSFAGLGIEPAKLVYRKRVADMPLFPLGDDPTPERLVTAERVRAKIVKNAMDKYGFQVLALRSPVRVHTEQGSVSAVTFRRMVFREGRFEVAGSEETIPTRLLVSSIGSIPEPITGIPMQGELYDWNNPYTGAVSELESVYGVGNALTGRGNIKESTQSARRMGALVRAGVLDEEPDYAGLFKSQEEAARVHVAKLLTFLRKLPPTRPEQRESILNRVAEWRRRIGYNGDYATWRDGILAERSP